MVVGVVLKYGSNCGGVDEKMVEVVVGRDRGGDAQ